MRRVRDFATGADLADLVPDVSGAGYGPRIVRFTTCGSMQHRPTRVFRHRLGTAAPTTRWSTVVDPATSSASPGSIRPVRRGLDLRSRDVRIWLIDLRIPTRGRCCDATRTSMIYNVEHHPSPAARWCCSFHTNADGAGDFKIAVALASPGSRIGATSFHIGRASTSCRSRYGRLTDPARARDGLPHRRASSRQRRGARDCVSEEAYSPGMDPGPSSSPTRCASPTRR